MSELKRTPAPNVKPKQIQAKEGAVKKQPLWKRMKESLFEEGIKNVGLYLWKDVLLPAIKKLLVDGANNAINMAVYGENRSLYRNIGQTHTSQSSIYAGRSGQYQYNRANRYQNIMDHCPPCDKDLLLDIIHEAMDWIAQYGKISVEIFRQILPRELAFDTVYTDQNWGWFDLNENCIVSVPGGYILDMPPAKPLQ